LVQSIIINNSYNLMVEQNTINICIDVQFILRVLNVNLIFFI